MNDDDKEEGKLTRNSVGIGTVNREMVLERARELAVINGRSPHHLLESDFEQAKRELTGEQEEDPKEALIESVPETERWDPVPGSTGHKAPTVSEHDEQIDNQKLVEEGVEEAEQDQMHKASEEAWKRDEKEP